MTKGFTNQSWLIVITVEPILGKYHYLMSQAISNLLIMINIQCMFVYTIFRVGRDEYLLYIIIFANFASYLQFEPKLVLIGHGGTGTESEDAFLPTLKAIEAAVKRQSVPPLAVIFDQEEITNLTEYTGLVYMQSSAITRVPNKNQV